MAFYTEDPIQGIGLSILDAPVGLGEATGAAFDQSLETSITPLFRESVNLFTQDTGGVRYDPVSRELQSVQPTTGLLTREQAQQQVKDSGLEVDVPDGGMRQGSLDLLLSRRRAERERSILMQNAPGSAAPAMIIASFAAQAVDPINIASAFIPVVGEARYTAMLAGAAGFGARLGVRAGVGAVEGAVGSALLEPAVYTLSQQLQDDYDITDSLTNIAFGAALGGSLRGIGGIVKDRYFPSAKIDVGDSLDDMPAPARAELSRAGYVDDSFTRLNRDLEIGLAEQRASSSQAIDNLMPSFRAELEQAATGRISNVADMRVELDAVNRKIEAIPDEFKDRAKMFQDQGMSRKQAERASRESIANEVAEAKGRRSEVEQAIEGNRQSELARADLARLDRGEIPERFKDRIDGESSRLAAGMTKTKLADALSPVPFAEKAELLRNSLGAAFNGLDISPKTFLDLKSPDANIRQQAIDHIKIAPSRTPKEYVQASAKADAEIKSAKDGQAFEDEQLQADEASAKEVADQTGYNLKEDPELKEAEAFEVEAQAYQDVYRANALCMLRG
jgi:hypothetical protein